MARPSKFVKYLSRKGWTCSVLSTNAENYWLQDSTRLKDVPPDARVYRTPGITGIGILRRLFRKTLHDQSRRTGLMGRLRTLTAWFLIPDSFVGWIPFAVIAGVWICRRDRVDVIMATAPPNSSAVVGWLLSRLTGLPLVTDFRDLWVEEIHFQAPTPLHRALHEYLESRVVDASSAVLFTNPLAAESMRERHGGQGSFVDVRMGYDPDDYASLVPKERTSKKIRMIYTGNLTLNRPIRGLLEALAQLQESGELSSSELEVMMFGQRDDEKDEEVQRCGLPHVLLKDNVSHDEAVQWQAAADILLFMGYNTNEKVRMVTSGKVYEYLYFHERFGTPILAISSRMDATDLLIGSPSCRVAAMDDVPAIRAALMDLVGIVRSGTSRPAVNVASHSIEASVHKLSGILSTLAGG